jgi:2-polyprenyl-3-methyl-5-hydroxy-6-metoxy-1,4-benzoquinol methylase
MEFQSGEGTELSMFECTVCHNREGKELLLINKPDRFEVSIGVSARGYERRWVECLECGTVNNVLPDDSLNRIAALRSAYYEVDFQGSDVSQKYELVMSLPPDQSDNAGRVNRVISFCERWFENRSNFKVMDIGAGTGVFLSRLVDQTDGKWDCLGVEPDPRAAEHLKRIDKFRVHEGLYSGGADFVGFNLVTLNKVLEHIEHPEPFLRDVVESLDSENGIIYIEVPDTMTIDLRPPNDNILGALHCHLYDPRSLSNLLHMTGLSILSVARVADPSGKLTVYAFAAPTQAIMRKEFPHE